MNNRLAPLAIAATLLAAAVPATAQDLNTRQVHVADLDLATASGQSMLRQRIGRAVEGVCGSYATTAEPTAQDAITVCRKTATADIHRQIAAHATPTTLAAR